MKRIGKLKHRVTALLMSFLITSGLITSTFSFEAKAEALPEMLESTATIADCVMTYYAMSGSAVTNTEWINTLYNSLGSSFGTLGEFAENGLMTFEDGVWKPLEQLTNNIANTSAYTNLGLDTVFNVSVEEAAAGGGLTAASGAATLSGAAGCVATYGILPVLGGVTASYWGGIALGTLIAHKIGLYDKKIYNAQAITFTDSQMAQITGGASVAKVKYRTSSSQTMYFSNDVRCYFIGYMNGYKLISTLVCLNANKPNESFTFNYSSNQVGSWSSPSTTTYTLNSHGVYYTLSDNQNFDVNNTIPLKLYDSVSDYRTALNNLSNTGVSDYIPYSPDLIGEKGNLIGDKNSSGNIVVPDMKPQIDPQTQAGKPLSLNDWLQFANGAQNNNSSTSPISNNTNLFADIMNGIKTLLPETPDPGPTPDPNPGGETYPVPGPVPNPTPVPDNDYQPETKPQPEYTEKATENETDITEGDPYTTPDLLDRFPFCIPRDIYRVFTKLDSGARSAPHIQWRFHPNEKIDYTFDVDFAEWDSIAVLLRTLELLGFIVALAVATRKLIFG